MAIESNEIIDKLFIEDLEALFQELIEAHFQNMENKTNLNKEK